jgi:hypothetical protein
VVHLGYPSYFLVLLGSWKVLGAVALLIPRRPLLKEWAYAGAFLTYTGAIVSPPDHRLRPGRAVAARRPDRTDRAVLGTTTPQPSHRARRPPHRWPLGRGRRGRGQAAEGAVSEAGPHA